MSDDWFDRYSYTDEWKRDTKEERLKKLNDRNTFLVQEYNKIEQRLKDYQKLQAQLDEANRFIDCLEAETSSMDMCKKIKSYREKYKAVSDE
jgi:predicted nucleic-acid-binding protein